MINYNKSYSFSEIKVGDQFWRNKKIIIAHFIKGGAIFKMNTLIEWRNL
jgi:hypothetical protein